MADLLATRIGHLADVATRRQANASPCAAPDARTEEQAMALADDILILINETAADFIRRSEGCKRMQAQEDSRSTAWSRLGGKAMAYDHCAQLLLQLVT